MNETQQAGTRPSEGDWWSRRPRRSRQDSKVAGVAGGLGRYFGVDPVLFRVAFVVMTIFGGIGVLTYCLAWLLLPADGDEVSAAESLIGRGRSSVSPIVAVGLALAAMISIASTFSWGLPFWPVAIAALVAFTVARKRRRGPFRPGSDWEARMRAAQQTWGGSNPLGGGSSAGSSRPGWGGGGGHGFSSSGTEQSATSQNFATYGSPGATDVPSTPSPFDTPAFWDQSPSAAASPRVTNNAPDAGRNMPEGAVNMQKASTDGRPQPQSTPPPSAFDFNRTPPAWDPLGAAPFAWDLPEIDLAPTGSTAVAVSQRSGVVTRITMGVALLVGALASVGVIGGWWMMSWAAVSASVLAVIALGLLVGAIRGRGHGLIGYGIFFSILTLALSVTGLTGTDNYGDFRYAPTQISAVQASYQVNAGNGVLDLSGLKLTQGQLVSTELEVRAGQGTVILPTDVNVEVTCSSDVGNMNCLGQVSDGFRSAQTVSDTDPAYAGTINLTVHVNAGNLEVSRG